MGSCVKRCQWLTRPAYVCQMWLGSTEFNMAVFGLGWHAIILACKSLANTVQPKVKKYHI